MSHSNSSSGNPKPNCNKHFPRSFLLWESVGEFTRHKILARLKDWNCEWLSRPNIAMLEMASTLKDNMDTLQRYKGTVFTNAFTEQLRGVITPIMGPLQCLDNKDRSTNPPTQDDVLDVLEAIHNKEQVEDLFVHALNACGPVLMMAIHSLAINTLMQNPAEFA